MDGNNLGNLHSERLGQVTNFLLFQRFYISRLQQQRRSYIEVEDNRKTKREKTWREGEA